MLLLLVIFDGEDESLTSLQIQVESGPGHWQPEWRVGVPDSVSGVTVTVRSFRPQAG